MLDAVAYRGRRLNAGERVTAEDIRGHAQRAGAAAPRHPARRRGVRAHRMGRAVDRPVGRIRSFTELLLAGARPRRSMRRSTWPQRTVVLVALDNPFTDPVPTPPPPETLPDLPFSVHHNNLTRHGIHQIQNLVLDQMARDRVSLSCAIVLPLRIRGGAGSTVRPIAVGAPSR